MDFNINVTLTLRLEDDTLARIEALTKVLVKNVATPVVSAKVDATQPATTKTVPSAANALPAGNSPTKTTPPSVVNTAAKTAQPPAVNMAEKTAPPATGAIPIEKLRALLNEKVTDNREAIRAKLTEFNSKSISLLEPKYYADMFNFLNSL